MSKTLDYLFVLSFTYLVMLLVVSVAIVIVTAILSFIAWKLPVLTFSWFLLRLWLSIAAIMTLLFWFSEHGRDLRKKL